MAQSDPAKHNRKAWDSLVSKGNRWTVPVTGEQIAAAKAGDWKIVLTPEKPVPDDWLKPVAGKKILCLAGGGGQQAPILAAAGAEVTTLDNSPSQLEQDRLVASREGLAIETVLGDMRDLSAFENESFDVIVNPCSNSFVPDVNPVWKECHRVLKPGGSLMVGFINPLTHIFDYEKMEAGDLEVRHKIPYSDYDLPEAERQALIDQDEPLWFGHSLEDQIGGQIEAGFVITGFYEDRWPELAALSDRINLLIATRALKVA
ncbi:class I SAM-dependent methyltransferase [Mariniblastus fucicola]|uniref:Ubiquinone biosynthesis O-methyltransferase n=1 Tax=Mariniblastus fucicola TaxID=980251 RepID=A0A5B9PFB3_9BACT|nr:class I SAM-dependent methyltransferase [Mariniblastus fucicola]QEG24239.1 Ubiquinone biosynthesis O-methyltransferase [Mariniblastus fucicola]